MRQSWGKLLFMHWRVPLEAVRRLVPERLAIDTFDGAAWVGLVPFTMWAVRPAFVPPIPGLSRFHEMNLRTYVHLDGVPGVWFFSLDASNRLAVVGGRAFYHLPYHHARIDLEEHDGTIAYASMRSERGPRASLLASWTTGAPLPETEPGSLDFFLTERYCLYAAHGRTIYRGRIFHRPWPLRPATLLSFQSTVLEAEGLPAPEGAPLLHSGGPVDVEIWPLQEV